MRAELLRLSLPKIAPWDANNRHVEAAFSRRVEARATSSGVKRDLLFDIRETCIFLLLPQVNHLSLNFFSYTSKHHAIFHCIHKPFNHIFTLSLLLPSHSGFISKTTEILVLLPDAVHPGRYRRSNLCYIPVCLVPFALANRKPRFERTNRQSCFTMTKKRPCWAAANWPIGHTQDVTYF